MTDEQIILVQKTWKIFRSIQPTLVGDVFYGKLFLMQPEFRKLFPPAMNEQYRKLMDMLSIIVARLERLDQAKEEMSALGRRHAGYGVKPEYFKDVGKALLWTLQQGLGSDWTKEVEEAWIKCYSLMSEVMIDAMGSQKKKNRI